MDVTIDKLLENIGKNIPVKKKTPQKNKITVINGLNNVNCFTLA